MPEPAVGPAPVLHPGSDPGCNGWWPDPWRRHQSRYHDGRLWTEHVADGGLCSVDSTPVADLPRSRPPSPLSSPTEGLGPRVLAGTGPGADGIDAPLLLVDARPGPDGIRRLLAVDETVVGRVRADVRSPALRLLDRLAATDGRPPARVVVDALAGAAGPSAPPSADAPGASPSADAPTTDAPAASPSADAPTGDAPADAAEVDRRAADRAATRLLVFSRPRWRTAPAVDVAGPDGPLGEVVATGVRQGLDARVVDATGTEVGRLRAVGADGSLQIVDDTDRPLARTTPIWDVPGERWALPPGVLLVDRRPPDGGRLDPAWARLLLGALLSPALLDPTGSDAQPDPAPSVGGVGGPTGSAPARGVR